MNIFSSNFLCTLMIQALRQKRILSLFCALSLLYIFLSNLYHVPTYSCEHFKYASRIGSISKRQKQFDKLLVPYLESQESEDLPNSDLSDWTILEPHVFAYSAYISETDPPNYVKTRYFVKILTVVLPSLPILKNNPTNLSCLLHFSDGRIVTTTSFITILPEHHEKCYRAAFIFCPVTSHALPSKVSLTSKNSTGKWIKVESALLNNGHYLEYEISLCVRPLFGPYDSIIQLAEFIGYYQSMGVTRFLLYNYTVTEYVNKFLRVLSKNSTIKVDVLPWSLSNIHLDDYLLHAAGQMIFNQDCILRLSSNSRYVFVVDLDEFVMPQQTLNLGKVLRNLEAENLGAGSFILSAIMFCEELLPRTWENKSLPLLTQTIVNRQKTPWIHTFRSKYIVKPQRISIAMIHEIAQHVEPFYSVEVPPAVILLYHCRQCCGLSQPWLFGAFTFKPLEDDEFIEDRRMQKLKRQLVESHPISLVRKMHSQDKI